MLPRRAISYQIAGKFVSFEEFKARTEAFIREQDTKSAPTSDRNVRSSSSDRA